MAWLIEQVDNHFVSFTKALLPIALVILSIYLLPLLLDKGKQYLELEMLYRRFSSPLRLSASDLAFRLFSLLDDSPPDYLRSEILESHPTSPTLNSNQDPYFKHYKYVSTVYRMMAFLGWLEIYRQETTFLHPVKKKHTRRLGEAIGRIHSDLADGSPGLPENWDARISQYLLNHGLSGSSLPTPDKWKDCRLFREEMRAIGESMIISDGGRKTVLGYAQFVEILESEEVGATKRWTETVKNLLVDLDQVPKDFRSLRLKLVTIDLVDLMCYLDSALVDPRLLEWQKQIQKEFQPITYVPASSDK